MLDREPVVTIKSSGINDESENKVELLREEKLRTDILNAFKEVVAFYSPNHNFVA